MVSGMSGCVVTSAVMLLIKMAAVHSGTVDTAREQETFNINRGMGRYEYHAELKNWTEAHEVCQQSRGHLAIADSNDEADVLLEMIKANSAGANAVHIGVHDRILDGDYVTVRGQPLAEAGFQNRTTTAPPIYNDMNCGSLYYSTTAGNSGLMLDSPCDRPQPFICELRLWDDYDLIPGYGYYKLHMEARNWTVAITTCRSEGGFLLILNSIAERDALVDKYAAVLYSATGYFHIWYGAHHKFTNMKFYTIFDEPLADTGFSYWYPGYPVNDGYRALMLYFYAPSSANNLFSYPETNLRPFICKHDLHDLL